MKLPNELNIRSSALIGFILILICPLLAPAQDRIAVQQDTLAISSDSLAVQPDTLCLDRDISDVIRAPCINPPK